MCCWSRCCSRVRLSRSRPAGWCCATAPRSKPAARATPPAEAGRKKFVIDNEALKKNRVKKPAEEKQKLQLAAVAEVLKLIADCATRHPQDQQAYQICCQRSLPH